MRAWIRSRNQLDGVIFPEKRAMLVRIVFLSFFSVGGDSKSIIPLLIERMESFL
jgi:hypothetical protein